MLAFCLAALPPGAGAAGDLPAGLQEAGSATVAEIVDGDTLVLDDGRQLRLVGIQAPKLALGRAGFEPWPLAEEARAALEEVALGQTVALGIGGAGIDRHGRVLAQLYRRDGLWLQGEMLARGLARVYSFADNRALVAEMLALERQARVARRGIWADPWYRIRSPDGLGGTLDSFQIVEGRVLAATVVRNRGYVNFGDDWRTDFTISLDAAALRRFADAGVDIASLAGLRIRVRGWVKSFNGPMIDVTHPEQIEVLGE